LFLEKVCMDKKNEKHEGGGGGEGNGKVQPDSFFCYLPFQLRKRQEGVLKTKEKLSLMKQIWI